MSEGAGGGGESTGEAVVGAVKEIKVTAKEIVDRISTGQISGVTAAAIASGSGSNSSISKDGEGGLDRKRYSVGQISAEQKAVEQLLKAVEKWVQEATEGDKPAPKDVDNLHWVYSIESYLRSLDTDWTGQKTLTHKIASQLLVWLKQLFNLEAEKGDEYNSIHPHWDINGGLSAVTQMSLYLKFPNLYSLGYQQFQEEGKTPMVYCSDEIIGQQICSKIGLPYNCISVIDFTDPNWVELLESRLKADIKIGRVPIALLMNTAVRNLEKGVKMAEAHQIWVHFYGNNVLAYFLKRPQTNHLGSSFTLDLTRWFKTPKLPFLTLYKRPEKIDPKIMELCDLNSPRNEILCFTPWFVAHVFGKVRLIGLVNESIYRGKFLLEMVQRFKALAVVPNWSLLSDGTVILSTLTFQFNPSLSKSQSRRSQGSPNAVEDAPEHSVQYLDTLNSWLFHIMERDLKDILPLEFVFVETRSWSIHVDIIRTKKLTPESEAAIFETFENHMNVLQATVNQKIKFHKLVDECEEMIWINNENQWAGLGAVRYIPSVQRKKTNGTGAVQNGSVPNGGESSATATPVETTKSSEGKLTEEKLKEDVDHLNAQIVNKLRAIDSAFSLGEAPTGEWCVQFGMVTDETDVQELVRLVAATGQEIEESSEFFNRMSELVRKGIHEAEEELRKESEEALWEEGILRRVPIVGTFVSWFSPPSKETGVRGRAMNLTEGKVESTENIYKYHMQVNATIFNNKAQEAVQK